MRIVFKTRYPVPFFRIVLFLLLSLGSAFFYIARNSLIPQMPSGVEASAAMMSVNPIINTFQFEKPKKAPVQKSLFIEKNQTFREVMADLDQDTVDAIYGSARELYDLKKLRSGKSIHVTTFDGQFQQMEYSIDPFQTLIVKNDEGSIKAEILRHSVETEVIELGGVIEGSLYSSINHLGEGDELVIKFADIFEWDVDFVKELRAGDTFRIVFEKEYVKGQPYGYGRILAAQLNNRGRVFTALGTERNKNWEFFSPDGKGMKKAFLASPLKFNRISSGFTTRRFHPITKTYRPHYGIDYAAPSGTPVRAIGSGRVIFVGWGGGAGKTIKLQHNKEVTTVYCHLSRYASGIKQGASVSQGEVIGYVGSTGMSTAPHLDFRYIKNGKYVNFLTVKGGHDEPLSPSELIRFREATTTRYAELIGVELKQPSVKVVYAHPQPVQISESIY